MSEHLRLVIGDKNISTWSLRPWVAMRYFDIPFQEVNIKLDYPKTTPEIKKYSPSGLVPCLLVGDFTISDSLAILEYLAERYSQKNLWPEDEWARARARSAAAEMHSGFAALRDEWTMLFTETQDVAPSDRARADIARIDEIWTDARRSFGAGGDFLFGAFSIADAMFAPVVSRFTTYSVQGVSPETRAYLDAMNNLPAMREWGDGAKAQIANA